MEADVEGCSLVMCTRYCKSRAVRAPKLNQHIPRSRSATPRPDIVPSRATARLCLRKASRTTHWVTADPAQEVAILS